VKGAQDNTLDLAGRRVLVLGLGMSGRSAARFCADQGAQVVASDTRPSSGLQDLGELADLPGIEVRTGCEAPDAASFDLVVPSPGVPRARYAARARRAWGDIELAGRALSIPIVAVTGTNGKSTTVKLVEALLRAAGLRADAAGNVGRPVLDLVGRALDVAVIEVSSFQLEATEAFRPKVAAVLNLTPDHLDRHGDLASYGAAKERIFAAQSGDDVAVLNFDDSRVAAMASRAPARVLPFGRMHPNAGAGAWLEAGAVRLSDGASSQTLSLDGLALEGRHNRENVVAALACVYALGSDPAAGLAALADFRGLPHRSEAVATLGGVRFVNDSKATNCGAALRSLESFEAPILWIAGGRGKGADFADLCDVAAKQVVHAFLVGEAAAEIERTLAGRVRCERADSIEDATRRAAACARPGDLVLLSPACASFDQARSFEERGERFRLAVRSLAMGSGGSVGAPPAGPEDKP